MFHREGGGAGIKLTAGDDLSNAGGAVVSRDGKSDLLLGAAAQVQLHAQSQRRPLADLALRPRSRGDLPGRRRFRRRRAPRAFARRQDAGLRLAPRRRYLSSSPATSRREPSGSWRAASRGTRWKASRRWTSGPATPSRPTASPSSSRTTGNWRGWTWPREPSATSRSRPRSAQFAAPRVTWQEKMDMGPVKAKILRWPSQSPDGRWIAFEAFGRVWLQEVSGGKASGAPRRLTHDDAVAAEARVRARPSAPTAAGSRTSPGATPRAGTSGRRRPRRASHRCGSRSLPATTPIRRGRPAETGSRCSRAPGWSSAAASRRKRNSSRSSSSIR